jgi:glycosyltransferase involved in cell wall biosynthesis
VNVLATAGAEGPAAARNIGCAAARGDVLVFIDADCEPEPTWLRRLFDAARDAELVQGMVLPPVAADVQPFDRFLAVTTEYGLYQTANLAIRRELFDRIGGFESIIRPENGKELGEDAWLGWRAKRGGARSTFAADAVVRHVVFPRDALGYLGEQSRVEWFPAMVRLMPELREAFLYRRWFLSHRSARFDVALAAVVAAAATRRAAPLLATLPYLEELWKASGAWGHARRLRVAPVHVAGDVVRLVALVRGSTRERSAVL